MLMRTADLENLGVPQPIYLSTKVLRAAPQKGVATARVALHKVGFEQATTHLRALRHNHHTGAISI